MYFGQKRALESGTVRSLVFWYLQAVSMLSGRPLSAAHGDRLFFGCLERNYDVTTFLRTGTYNFETVKSYCLEHGLCDLAVIVLEERLYHFQEALEVILYRYPSDNVARGIEFIQRAEQYLRGTSKEDEDEDDDKPVGEGEGAALWDALQQYALKDSKRVSEVLMHANSLSLLFLRKFVRFIDSGTEVENLAECLHIVISAARMKEHVSRCSMNLTLSDLFKLSERTLGDVGGGVHFAGHSRTCGQCGGVIRLGSMRHSKRVDVRASPTSGLLFPIAPSGILPADGARSIGGVADDGTTVFYSKRTGDFAHAACVQRHVQV